VRVTLNCSGRALELDSPRVFAAAYTGRGAAAVQRHVDELAAAGVPPPARVPFAFPVLPRLLEIDPGTINVYGAETSGEAEPVIVLLDGEPRYVGVGSDHTDRVLERTSIELSKQVCPKVLALDVWKLGDVIERWDSLRLTASSDGRPYQNSSLVTMLPPTDLVDVVPRAKLGPVALLFCGTVPLLGDLDFGRKFHVALVDEAANRSLQVDYEVEILQGS